MIDIHVGKDETEVTVRGKLSEIIVETGFILKAIQEAISRQDKRAGEIFRGVVIDEDFIQRIFEEPLEMSGISVKEHKIKKSDYKDLYRSLLSEFTEGDE